MPDPQAPSLSINTSSVLSGTKLIIELSDGRSLLFTLEQILTLTPERIVTEEAEED